MKSYLWPILLASSFVSNPGQAHTNFDSTYIQKVKPSKSSEYCDPITIKTPFQEKFDTWLQICTRIDYILLSSREVHSVRNNHREERQIKSVEAFLQCFYPTIMQINAPIEFIPVLWWRLLPVFNEVEWRKIAKNVAAHCSEITK